MFVRKSQPPHLAVSINTVKLIPTLSTAQPNTESLPSLAPDIFSQSSLLRYLLDRFVRNLGFVALILKVIKACTVVPLLHCHQGWHCVWLTWNELFCCEEQEQDIIALSTMS